MSSSSSALRFRPEFDEFLFAIIGEHENGTTLSMFSALARSDFDPWQEAASLRDMSKEAATRKIMSFIASLPKVETGVVDERVVAVRLVNLLPTKRDVEFSIKSQRSKPPENQRRLVLVTAVTVILALGALMLSARRPRPATNEPSASSSQMDSR